MKIWNANIFTDLYTIRVLTERYFRRGYNNQLITYPLSRCNNNSNNSTTVNKNQIYSTYPMFVFSFKQAFGGQCLHFQVFTIINKYNTSK